MIATYYTDSVATILHGDVLECLHSLPDASVQCCVTSPPYWGLRDYGLPPQDWPEATYSPMAGLPYIIVPAQSVCLGLEATPEAFVGHLVLVFREVRRALRADGTLWLNIGDSYAGSGGAHASQHNNPGISQSAKRQQTYGKHTYHDVRPLPDGLPLGLKAKDLCMIPARLALALQADGWWLRSDITWAKKAAMPESVTDRPTNATEKIFLFAKSCRYFYDAGAVREPAQDWGVRDRAAGKYTTEGAPIKGPQHRGLDVGDYAEAGRSLRNFWLLGPEPFPGAHFAAMPTAIPRRAITAGTSERGCCPACGVPWVRYKERTDTPDTSYRGGRFDTGKTWVNGSGRVQAGERLLTITVGWRPGCKCDAGEPVPCTVLDPFLGSGTTLAVAKELVRRGVGCDLNAEYLALAVHRVRPIEPGVQLNALDALEGIER